MKHFFTNINLIFILLLSIFGNSFLKYNLGISNFFTVLYYLFSVVHVLLFLKNKRIRINSLEKKVLKMFLWIILCMFLSFLGFYQKFNLNGILFDKSFILRQSFFFVFIPVGMSMYFSFLYDKDYIEKIVCDYAFFILFLFIILVNIKLCNNMTSYFILLFLSFNFIKNKKSKFLKFFAFIVSVFYILNIFSKSTAFLMLLVFIVMLLDKKIVNKIYNYRFILCLFLLILSILIISNYNDFLSFLQSIDMNYWWRFNYWINEFLVLKDTFFLGVGYGVTYASLSIFSVLNGGFIDPETGMFVNNAKVLFTTAQHNSIMNIFYRTGFIGLLLFFRYTFDLLFKSKSYIFSQFDKSLYMLFINANIIILFNVGLESPQYLFLYYFSMFGLLSLIRLNAKIHNS